jgi:hypothetical protein
MSERIAAVLRCMVSIESGRSHVNTGMSNYRLSREPPTSISLTWGSGDWSAFRTVPIRTFMITFQERVIGCFKALAAGDAIGKQTEMLSMAEVRRWYPGGITGFHGRPGEVIPRYAGKRYEWRVGETTRTIRNKPWRSRERSYVRAGLATRRSDESCCGAGNPFTRAWHCGPSRRLAIPPESLRRAMDAEPRCARRRSACFIRRAACTS